MILCNKLVDYYSKASSLAANWRGNYINSKYNPQFSDEVKALERPKSRPATDIVGVSGAFLLFTHISIIVVMSPAFQALI